MVRIRQPTKVKVSSRHHGTPLRKKGLLGHLQHDLTSATALNSTLAEAYSCISSTSAGGRRSFPDNLRRSSEDNQPISDKNKSTRKERWLSIVVMKEMELKESR